MIFFFIFSSFLTCLYLYTGLRLIPSLFNKKAARICWCILIFAMLALFVHLYLRVNFIYPDLSYFCAWIGYIGLGLISYLFCLAFLRDLILLLPAWIIRIKNLDRSMKDREPVMPWGSAYIFTCL